MHRALEPAAAVGDQRQRRRDQQSRSTTAISVSTMCWRSAGHSTRLQLSRHPVASRTAGSRARTRTTTRRRRSSGSPVRRAKRSRFTFARAPTLDVCLSATVPEQAAEQLERHDPSSVDPCSSTTVSGVPPAASSCESASRTVAVSATRSCARPQPVRRRQLDVGQRRAARAASALGRRRRTRRRTHRPGSSGSRPACRTGRACPPWRRIAILSPILIASSMSWVTNTTVLRTRSCSREELVLQPRAVDRVDRAERLVHQHQRRVGGQRARHADPLALPARELGRIAGPDLVRIQPDQRRAARPRALRCAACPTRAASAPWRCCPSTVRCGNRPICWIT